MRDLHIGALYVEALYKCLFVGSLYRDLYIYRALYIGSLYICPIYNNIKRQTLEIKSVDGRHSL